MPRANAKSKKQGTLKKSKNVFTGTKSVKRRTATLFNSTSCDMTRDAYCIISMDVLQKIIDENYICKTCKKGGGKFTQNSSNSISNGQCWEFFCDNNECTSLRTQYEFTPKTGSTYDINRMTVLAFRSIGKGRTAAQKVFSLMNLHKPISGNSWTCHTKSIESTVERVTKENLKEEAKRVKLHILKKSEEECDLSQTVDAPVSGDGAWGTKGWSSRSGLQELCYEGTGAVIDFCLKTIECKKCEVLERLLQNGDITETEYIERYLQHEPDCSKNHEGSSKVS